MKRDRVRDMPTNPGHCQRRPFRRVLMDVWYVRCDLMLFIGSLKKNDYCPLRASQQVADSVARSPHRRVANNRRAGMRCLRQGGCTQRSGINRPQYTRRDSLCRGGRHFGLHRLWGTCTPTVYRFCSNGTNGSISRVVQARSRK